ncbi:hypothetical protein MIND_01249800 [Mycena indigotica]|uniref:Uncharacterized protein n=1 Tax=Mycena indigotica TaxID=2126181 RepID=A0A8H6VXX0_9AGAR|nr:uncharacterized protein MIND_01249800 [Mycena indigotica]KAF7292224.1 hypothetical protein MIND_01249800 [Mycena indigotica]
MENTPPGPARFPTRTRPQDDLALKHRLGETPDARRVDTGETRISQRALGELRNDVRRREDMLKTDGQSELAKHSTDNGRRAEGAVTVASLRERLQDSLEDNAGLKSRCEELSAALEGIHVMYNRLAQTTSALRGENTSLQLKLLAAHEDQTIPTAKRERQLYLDFMAALPPPPSTRPDLSLLDPVLSKVRAWVRMSAMQRSREFMLLAGRTVWCSADKTHALVFSPQVYLSKQQHGAGAPPEWQVNHEFSGRIGKKVELFVPVKKAMRGGAVGDAVDDARDDAVFYAGVYKVHSLRSVHPPGSAVPDDVSVYHILRSMNIDTDPVGASRSDMETVLQQAVPADMPRGVECFGLQCVGFNNNLYKRLRRSGLGVLARSAGVKRSASDADIRGGGASASAAGARKRRRVGGPGGSTVRSRRH